MTRTHALAALALPLALSLALAACGGGDDDDGTDDTGGGSSADLVVVGLDPAAFDAAEYSLATGLRTIELDNQGSLVHTLLIERDGATVEGFKLSTTGGQSKSGKVTLEPGSYTLYCDISGHRSAGMEAALTVT